MPDVPRNPYLHAVLASLYIVALVSGIWYVGHVGHDKPDTILIPMAMLSLLVLSASVMGYLFIFEPVRLYIEGQKQEGIEFFFKTVGTFAFLTLLFVIALVLSY